MMESQMAFFIRKSKELKCYRCGKNTSEKEAVGFVIYKQEMEKKTATGMVWKITKTEKIPFCSMKCMEEWLTPYVTEFKNAIRNKTFIPFEDDDNEWFMHKTGLDQKYDPQKWKIGESNWDDTNYPRKWLFPGQKSVHGAVGTFWSPLLNYLEEEETRSRALPLLEAQGGICLECMKPISLEEKITITPEIMTPEKEEVVHAACYMARVKNVILGKGRIARGDMTVQEFRLFGLSIETIIKADLPSAGEAFERLLASEILGGATWGIKRELQRQRDRESTMKIAERIIEQLYIKYPKRVNRSLQEKGLYKLLDSLSFKCLNCGEMIPKISKLCPYCNKSPIGIPTKEDPLAILKIRLAKGEITQEEYEEMKKTLEED